MHFDEYRKHDATALAAPDRQARGQRPQRCWRPPSRGPSRSTPPSTPSCTSSTSKRARTSRPVCPGGPLAGVPYLIKDLAFLDKGEPARLGSSLFKDYVADHDSAYVARCKKAGLVIFGRTSTPEFGLNPTTEPRLYGPMPQPLEPRALGGRLLGRRGGSRHRRHPPRGARDRRRRLDPHPRGPVRPVRPQADARRASPWRPTPAKAGAGCRPATSSAAACAISALMLDCTAGTEPGDPYAAPTPERPFVEALAVRPKQAQDRHDAARTTAARSCIPNARRPCAGPPSCARASGHIVEEADPKLDLVALRPMNARIAAANIARNLGMRWKALGREPNPKDVERGTWAVYQRGLKVTGVEYVEAMAAVHAAGRRMAAFLVELRRDPLHGSGRPAAQARLSRPERRPCRRSPSASTRTSPSRPCTTPRARRR